jgi:hypothetical protein
MAPKALDGQPKTTRPMPAQYMAPLHMGHGAVLVTTVALASTSRGKTLVGSGTQPGLRRQNSTVPAHAEMEGCSRNSPARRRNELHLGMPRGISEGISSGYYHHRVLSRVNVRQ